ncbi:MAG: competence/damage-inducible protein A [Finegoldia sp.]|nr:competence/damage-inducible protein A [Finegoldia sp.]
MKAQIIAVGTELLLGDTLDTNSYYLSGQLKELGIDLYRRSTVGDNRQRLLEELKDALSSVDLVITTGGLGPTDDDLTKEVCCEALGKEMVLNQESYDRLKKNFEDKPEQLELNKKQAMFPEDAIVFENKNGTADAGLIESDGKAIIFLPGPPRELKPIFKNSVRPLLEKWTDSVIVSETLNMAGIGESDIYEKVRELALYSENPTVAPYATKNKVILKISAKAETREKALDLIKPMKEQIYCILDEYIYGENEESIEEAIYKLLDKYSLSIMTGESVTGGMIASRLINVDGISDYLKRSFVVYSNEAKIELLKVDPQTIDKYGVVSEQVATEMAKNMHEIYDCDCCIATTGYASGEEAGKVFLGLAFKDKLKCLELKLTGNRNTVRKRACDIALSEMRKMIVENVSRETF